MSFRLMATMRINNAHNVLGEQSGDANANSGAGFDPNNMGGNPGQQGGSSNQGGSDNVTDVDYEEVK